MLTKKKIGLTLADKLFGYYYYLLLKLGAYEFYTENGGILNSSPTYML
jgi:hypothetical protein